MGPDSVHARTDGKPIALAGLWDRRQSKDKSEKKETYTVVTTAPSAFAAQFHDRMPCVPEIEDIDAWLRASPDDAAALMRPAMDVLQERPLGKAINNVKNNAPELLAPLWRARDPGETGDLRAVGRAPLEDMAVILLGE